MAEQIWRGEVVSATSRNRDGTQKRYAVTLCADGTGTCTCVDYVLRSKNAGRPERPCKHIRLMANKNAATLAKSAPERARIAPEPRDVAPTAPKAPGVPTDTTQAPDAPVTRVPDGLGLVPADISRRARRTRY